MNDIGAPLGLQVNPLETEPTAGRRRGCGRAGVIKFLRHHRTDVGTRYYNSALFYKFSDKFSRITLKKFMLIFLLVAL